MVEPGEMHSVDEWTGLPRKVLQQTYSPRFSDFALEFYTFVADNDAPFYSTPIECTDRDAAFVLDGLLYNESDLDLSISLGSGSLSSLRVEVEPSRPFGIASFETKARIANLRIRRL